MDWILSVLLQPAIAGAVLYGLLRVFGVEKLKRVLNEANDTA